MRRDGGLPSYGRPVAPEPPPVVPWGRVAACLAGYALDDAAYADLARAAYAARAARGDVPKEFVRRLLALRRACAAAGVDPLPLERVALAGARGW